MHKVLIVTSQKDADETITTILLLENYKVTLAKNGKEAIELASNLRPDIILCEIKTKMIDGFGILHMIRKEDKLQTVPFVFLADKFNEKEFRMAMTLGADDYLLRPFNSKELIMVVENRLQKHMLYKKEASMMSDDSLVALHDHMTEEINNLIKNRKTIRLAAKEIVYEEGKTPKFLYYILSGKIKTTKTHEDGKSLVLGLYSAGDFFGYVAMLQETRYMATAIVMEDAELALIPRQEAEDIFNRTPLLINRFVRMLAKNLTEKENRMVGIAYDSLREKVARALINLDNKYNNDKGKPFEISISREELASIAGTATESLIRTLSDFKTEKLIAIKKGNILITNSEKLSAIASK